VIAGNGFDYIPISEVLQVGSGVRDAICVSFYLAAHFKRTSKELRILAVWSAKRT
jgi:hypothetical protein